MDARKHRGLELLDMPPLKKINPQGALNLMEAVYHQTTKDYLAAKRYLKSHPDSYAAQDTVAECSEFFGKDLTESIERVYKGNYKLPYKRT